MNPLVTEKVSSIMVQKYLNLITFIVLA